MPDHPATIRGTDPDLVDRVLTLTALTLALVVTVIAVWLAATAATTVRHQPVPPTSWHTGPGDNVQITP